MVSLLAIVASIALTIAQTGADSESKGQGREDYEYIYSPDPYFMMRVAAMAEAKGLPPPMMIPMEGPPQSAERHTDTTQFPEPRDEQYRGEVTTGPGNQGQQLYYDKE